MRRRHFITACCLSASIIPGCSGDKEGDISRSGPVTEDSNGNVMNPAFVLTGSEIKNGGGYKITAGVATGGADSITFTYNGEQIAEVGDGNHVIASSVSSTPNPLQENDLLVVHATWGDQKDEELRWRVGEGTVENMEDAEIIVNNTIN